MNTCNKKGENILPPPPPRGSVADDDEVRIFPWSSTEAADEVEVTSEADALVTEGFRNSKLTFRLKLAKSPM